MPPPRESRLSADRNANAEATGFRLEQTASPLAFVEKLALGHTRQI